MPQPTLARGMAALAALACIAVAGGRLLQNRAPARAQPTPICAQPVEVVDAAGTRLGCAGDDDLAACGSLAAGSRVLLEPTGCRLDGAGMRASLRLLYGIKLDLNRASAEDLALLDGVGPRLAARIVAYRTEHGPFGSIAELVRVRGIGDATVKKLEPYLEVRRGAAD